MTISTTESRKSYTGNGSTAAFSFPYKFLADGDLKVYVDNVLKTLTTDYTVSGAGSESGGTVTFVTAPASLTSVVFYRDMAITQEVDYITGDAFPAETHEEALDRLTMIDQQQEDQIDRAVKLQLGDETSSMELPVKATRATKMLGFDADGDPIMSASTVDEIDASVTATFATGILASAYQFTGDGTTVDFTLGGGITDIPNSQSIIVDIDGVTQHTDTYSVSGKVVTFSTAPPLNGDIQVRYNAYLGTATDAASATYNQGGTGASSRTVENKLQESVSVKDFGAVGDGVTDDGPAIQAALDAHNSVYMPYGVYLTSSTIYLHPHSVLTGMGDAGMVSNSSVVRLSPHSSFVGDSMIEIYDTFDVSGERRFEIRDLFVNCYNGSYVAKNAIKITGSGSGRITNVSCSNASEYGMKLEKFSLSKFSSNVQVENCYVRMPNEIYDGTNLQACYYTEGLFTNFVECLSDGGFNGIVTGGSALGGFNTISKCHPEGWLNAGIVLGDTNGKNTVTECDVVATRVAGDVVNGVTLTTSYGILSETASCYDNIIIGNTIYNLNNAVTYFTGSAGIKIGTNVGIISNNIIKNFEYGVHITGSDFTLNGNQATVTKTAYYISGSNNTLSGCFGTFDKATGYLVDNAGGQASNKCSLMSSLDATYQLYNLIYPTDKSSAVSAYQGTLQTLATITNTKLLFQTEVNDESTGFDPATSIFTAPVAGYYLVSAGVGFATTVTVATLTIRVQGSEVHRVAYDTDATVYSTNGSAVVYMNTGWSLEMYVLVVGTPNTVANKLNTYLTLDLMSQT